MLAVLDVVISLVFYFALLPKAHNSMLRDFIRLDTCNYSFRSSAIDILVLGILRSLILFVCFGYKYQTKRSAIQTTLLTSFCSFVFLVVKISLASTSERKFGFCSLLFLGLELAIFLVTRKRRISAPADLSSPISVAPGDYSRIDRSSDDYDSKSPGKALALVVRINESAEIVLEPRQVLKFPQSMFCEFNGETIHYVYSPNESSMYTLVFIHGFIGGAFSWYLIWLGLSHLNKEAVL
jgi:hypothetical protein